MKLRISLIIIILLVDKAVMRIILRPRVKKRILNLHMSLIVKGWAVER
jgi:multisubunit Na+/H+ antiporter MnhF subunit